MTSARDSTNEPVTVCCGDGAMKEHAGKPLVPGCMLCPSAASYWRRPENRDSGEPYESVQSLG